MGVAPIPEGPSSCVLRNSYSVSDKVKCRPDFVGYELRNTQYALRPERSRQRGASVGGAEAPAGSAGHGSGAQRDPTAGSHAVRLKAASMSMLTPGAPRRHSRAAAPEATPGTSLARR